MNLYMNVTVPKLILPDHIEFKNENDIIKLSWDEFNVISNERSRNGYIMHIRFTDISFNGKDISNIYNILNDYQNVIFVRYISSENGINMYNYEIIINELIFDIGDKFKVRITANEKGELT